MFVFVFFRYTLFTLLIEYACLKQSETSIFILNDLGLASMFNATCILINNVINAGSDYAALGLNDNYHHLGHC